MPQLSFILPALLPVVYAQWGAPAQGGRPSWGPPGGQGWQPDQGPGGYDCKEQPFKHVITISVDGLHSSDVGKWVALSPNGNISQLLQHGYEYTNAWTTAPSDSFPGSMAQYTGATPPTTGVWYDDTWDHSYYAPSSGCAGAPGAEVVYDESIDYNSTQLFSGGIDPANLPEAIINGKCTPIYPHNRLRVGTTFEVVTAAGFQTAYTDKHPAYDIVRGPSGTGLTVGYFPEIAAVGPTVADTIAYDQLHVNAWLDWLDVTTPVNTTVYNGSLTQIPTLFGGNFQAMSVAQKTVGYANDSTSSFSAAEVQAMTFIDASIGAVVNKLKAKNIYDDTLIVVASKHGQAPINRTLFNEVNPKCISGAVGVPTQFITFDDIALVFLNNSADTNTAAANLQAAASKCKIRSVIYGQNLTASGFGNPATDPAVPNVIVQPELGVIYTTSTAKVAEHGGISTDDRVVACFASSPKLQKTVFSQRVNTTQVAATSLHALGLQPQALAGIRDEQTQVLPGFS
ncbi:hypothetical protein LTR78_004856 [Recurvomyces mirabilis]|uniref:Type I phosphodiesterase/nucleotide pyrophosphatase n=1 Tax=Recurvomyces mirabilis TaxID=574656 RepID=A0AAE0WPD2_9PEZI|nr:hypothetical protein LTR78_004856 [Recurvomyces mirabilis]KAK5158027.1 hypothetical protein LTS14_003950 [Recurvomyces mirabilis]